MIHIIIGKFVQLVMHCVKAAIHGSPVYNYTTDITAAFPPILSHAAVPLSIYGHTLTVRID